MIQEYVISKKDKQSYLILYGPTWDGASQVSKHHLAKYWAKLGHSVLYVESQFHLISFITRMKEAFRLSARFIFGPNKITNNFKTSSLAGKLSAEVCNFKKETCFY